MGSDIPDDVSEEKLNLDHDDGEIARARQSNRTGSDDYASDRSRSSSRSRSRSRASYDSRSPTRSSRHSGRSSEYQGQSRSLSRSSKSRSERSRSRSASSGGSRGRGRGGSRSARSRSYSRERAPIGSRSVDVAGRGMARTRSPGWRGKPRSLSPGRRGSRRRSPGPPWRPPPFGDPRDRFMGPPPGWDPRFGAPPPPPGAGYRDRGPPPPMIDPRDRGLPPLRGPPLFGPRDGPGYGLPPPFMPRDMPPRDMPPRDMGRRGSPPPPRDMGRRGSPPPPPMSERDRFPPPGSITREVTATRIPTRGPDLGPPPPARAPLNVGPLGPDPLGLHGPPPPPGSATRRRQSRGGRRVQRKKELARERERMAAERVRASGSNVVPLGGAARSHSPVSPGVGKQSSGEYVMLDAAAGRPDERAAHDQPPPPARHRVRSAVVAPTAAGKDSNNEPHPSGDGEQASKRSRHESPAPDTTNGKPFVSSVMMQRMASLQQPLTAEEREAERQRQKQQQQGRVEDAGVLPHNSNKTPRVDDAKGGAGSDRKRDRSRVAAANSPEEYPASGAVVANGGHQAPQQQRSSPALGSAVPDRLKGRLAFPDSADDNWDHQAAVVPPRVAADRGERWQPEPADDDAMPDLHEHQAARAKWATGAAALKMATDAAVAAAHGGNAKQQQPAPKQPPKLADKQLRQQEAASGKVYNSAGTPPPAAAAVAYSGSEIFDEFAEVWYYKDEGQVIGPKSIRMLRRLARNLPAQMKVEMDNMECFTRLQPPEFKLLKHLLRFGDSSAPDP